MDEITLTGTSRITEYRPDGLFTYTFDPQDYDLDLCAAEDLKGGDTAEGRARIIHDILAGNPGPRRSITELNAAAALMVSSRAHDFAEGLELAAESIDSGAARRVLDRLVEISNTQEASA
jgi:anthranilate phosphoribosyltransferase